MQIFGKHITLFIILISISLTADAQYIDTVCAGDKGVSYRTGPTPGSVYYWTVQNGTIDSATLDSSTVWINWGLTPGVGVLTAKEITKEGCPGVPAVALVLIRPLGTVQIFGPDLVCKGEVITLKAAGAETYLWSNGSTGDQIFVRPDFDTTFSVLGFIGECKTNTSLHDLQVKYKPIPDFTFDPDKPIIGQDVQFTYTGTNNVDHWLWEFREINLPSSFDDRRDPDHRFSQPGIKTIKLTVKNDFGCMDSITKFIVVESGINVFIPDGFTPNGDGFNQVFIPTYENIKSAHMEIFDRWGERMFSTDKMTEGWDATYKGAYVPDGVFVYIVNVIGMDDRAYTFHGTVTLLR